MARCSSKPVTQVTLVTQPSSTTPDFQTGGFVLTVASQASRASRGTPASPASRPNARDTSTPELRPSLGPLPPDVLEVIVDAFATALLLDLQEDPDLTVHSPSGPNPEAKQAA